MMCCLPDDPIPATKHGLNDLVSMAKQFPHSTLEVRLASA
jgi:hypothetical protein